MNQIPIVSCCFVLGAENNPHIGKWLERNWRKFTSHKNKHQFLKIMFYSILIKLLGDIHNSPFIIVMADKTTAAVNKMQLTMVIRWVDENITIEIVLWDV